MRCCVRAAYLRRRFTLHWLPVAIVAVLVHLACLLPLPPCRSPSFPRRCPSTKRSSRNARRPAARPPRETRSPRPTSTSSRFSRMTASASCSSTRASRPTSSTRPCSSWPVFSLSAGEGRAGDERMSKHQSNRTTGLSVEVAANRALGGEGESACRRSHLRL